MTKLIFIAIAILFLSSIAVCGEIYTWTDANGIKRFSNNPPPAHTESKVIGKEINYVAPPEPPKPQLSVDDRLEMKAKSDQLEIERQKTHQKALDAQTAAANARAAAFESNAKIIESGRKQINGLLGVPYR